MIESTKRGWLISLLSLFIGLAVWQVVSLFREGGLIPSPLQILATFYDLLLSGELGRHTIASLGRLLPGWLLGIGIGATLGILLAVSRRLFYLFIPWLALIFPIPKIALFPLFIILFGIGDSSRIITIIAGVLFPTLFCVYQGVKAVPGNLVDMGWSFQLSKKAIIRHIILPGAYPGLFLAFRLTTPIALIVLVAAEMLGAQEGIGSLILAAGGMAQMDILFAGVLVLSLIGLSVMVFWNWLEARVIHWQSNVSLFR